MTGRDLLRVRFRWTDATAALPRPARVELFRALDGDDAYAYLPPDAPWRAPPGASVSELSPLLDLAGASRGALAPFHYVVETDVLAEREADFNAWYDTEHMPGLAAVPGTVRARRFRAASGSPRYHACYDLASAQTLGCPAWLAVRATPWSDRVRPAFRNTRRTMYRRIA